MTASERGEVETVARELALLRRRLGEREEQIARSLAERDEISACIEAIEKTIAGFGAALEETNRALEFAQGRMQEESARRRGLEAELARLKEEFAQLERSLAGRMAIIHDLEAEAANLRGQIGLFRCEKPVTLRHVLGDSVRLVRSSLRAAFKGLKAQIVGRFRWRWLTPVRSRRIGFVKLVFLLGLTFATYVYLRIFERAKRVRVLP